MDKEQASPKAAPKEAGPRAAVPKPPKPAAPRARAPKAAAQGGAATKKATPTKAARPAKQPSATTQARKAASTAKATVQAETDARIQATDGAAEVGIEPLIDDLLLAQLDAVLAELDPAPAPVDVEIAVNATPTAADQERPPLWAHLVADPGYAAEHVARDAVRRLGPDARDWAVGMRVRYPGATSDGLARLATAEIVRSARRQGAGAVFGGTAGSWAAVAVLARVQARLVLTIAAVYGLDPTADLRAREVLDLLRVPRLTQPGLTAARNGGRLIAGVALRRLAARTVPFGAAVAGALHSGRSTEAVAVRAMRAYRNGAYKNEAYKNESLSFRSW
jgi:hypothetical protein